MKQNVTQRLCPQCDKPLAPGVTRCWNKGCDYVMDPCHGELLDNALARARARSELVEAARDAFHQALRKGRPSSQEDKRTAVLEAIAEEESRVESLENGFEKAVRSNA